jgi:3-oxoadipate enol-lactonase
MIVHHVVTGPQDAPALVLSNSLGSSLAMWDAQAAPLAERFRLIRYDLRGHGASPVPPGPYSLDDLGGDVVALLDHLGIERASLAGISLGGMIGMWLGIHAPERIERLVLCCTSAQLGPPEMWSDRAALVREQGTGAVAPAVAARWVTDALAARRPELEAMIAATPPEGYAATCAAVEHMDLLPRLGEIRAPALVISAEQDQSTPPEHGRRIAAGIPGARFEVLDGAAHLANLERPDEITALIAGHLES